MKVDIDKYLAENEVEDEASPEVDIDAYLEANESERMPIDPVLGAARKAGFGDNVGIDALELIGDVADYTAAPIRGAAVGAIKGLKDQYYDNNINPLPTLRQTSKGFVEPLVKGPGSAPTGKELAQEMAIPEEYADEAGFALDMLSGFAGPSIMNVGSKIATESAELLGRGASKVGMINPTESAAGVIGLNDRARQALLSEKGSGKYNEALDYAKKNIISGNPFKSSAKSVLGRVQKKTQEIGDKIGALRSEAADDIQRILSSPSKQNFQVVDQYLKNGFGTPNSLNRMNALIDETVEDALTARKMKAFVKNVADAQMQKYQGSTPDFKQLTKLKTEWQNEVDYLKASQDRPWKQAAYDILTKEASNAMDNELDFLGKAGVFKSSQKARHNALKKEYGILKTIEESALPKASKLMEGMPQPGDSLVYNVPFVGPFLKAAKNRLIDPNLARAGQERMAPQIGPLMKNILGGAQVLPAAARPFYERPVIDGYSIEETQPVDPNTGAMILNEIQNDASISVVEKAKIISNYNKTGRIPI